MTDDERSEIAATMMQCSTRAKALDAAVVALREASDAYCESLAALAELIRAQGGN